MTKQKAELDNGLIVEVTKRLHHTRIVFTDRDGKKYRVCFTPRKNEISTDFCSYSMVDMGFKPFPEDFKAHVGRFTHRLKLPKDLASSSEWMFPHQPMIISAVISTGCRVYTYREKAAEAIQKEAVILARTDEPMSIQTAIANIREYLQGIEQKWTLQPT